MLLTKKKSESIDTTKPFQGQLRLTQTNGPVGSIATVKGDGFKEKTDLELIWESYDLDWKIEEIEGVKWNEFQGLTAVIRREQIARICCDEFGSFKETIEIPEDYGGLHDIYLVDPESKHALNKCAFRIDASAEIDKDSGPLGTPINVTLKGINPIHPLEGWYLLCYDNHPTGYLTAVRTRGTASAQISATGTVGPHLISIEKGSFGEPFLGVETTPYHYTKTFHMLFELCEGDPILPPPIQEQIDEEIEAIVPDSLDGTPIIWADPVQFPARIAFNMHGRNFQPNSKISLKWNDMYGDRVSELRDGHFGTGFSEERRHLGDVQCDANGAFDSRFVHEGSQGGPHAIEAYIDGEMISRTFVTVGRRPHLAQPKSGKVGTKIKIEVEGVGWTEYENIVCINYDNAYVGYKCGNDLMGRAIVKFHAAGQKGLHYIDLYPAIYRNQDFAEAMEMPFIYQKPILTWRDHPHGFHFRYVFKVE